MSTDEEANESQDETNELRRMEMLAQHYNDLPSGQSESANELKKRMELWTECGFDNSETLMPSDETDVIEKNWSAVPGFKKNISESRANKLLLRHNTITMCIWYYDETLPDGIQSEVTRKLRSFFDYIRIFTDPDSLKAYLDNNFIANNVIFIIYGKKSIRPLCEFAQQHKECYHLYKLNIEDKRKTRSSRYSRALIRDIVDLIEHICSIIMPEKYSLGPVETIPLELTLFAMTSVHVPTFVQDAWSSFSIFDSDLKEINLSSTSQSALEFLLFQLLTKVLLDYKHDSYAFEEMFLRCRQHCENSEAALQTIDELQNNYCSDQAINYYLQDTSLNRLVQEAYCTKDIELIFALRFYISDLHKQLIQAANKQDFDSSRNTVILYRNLQLSKTSLQKLNDNIDCLISINEFFSSTEKDTDGHVTSDIREDQDICNILLKLYIDTTIANKSPFIYLLEYGAVLENEILFSTCSVWRLKSINESNNKLWIITLNLSNDFESYLSNFHDKLLPTRDLLTLADLCCKLGEYSTAQVFYHHLLIDDIPDEIYRDVSRKIVVLSSEEHASANATAFLFRQGRPWRSSAVIDRDIQQAALRAFYIENNLPTRLTLLNNIGIFYWKIGSYRIARKSFETALEQQGPPIDMSKVYYNIGQLECVLHRYKQAHMYLTNAMNLSEGNIYQNKYLESLEMIEAKMAPKYLIELHPNELPIESSESFRLKMPQTWLENLEDSQDIIILCLDVAMSETSPLSMFSIESFQDEFKFIARALSIKDKTIYAIISLTMSDYIIPLIHRHYCIETIYLFDSTNSEPSFNWSSISEKISGPFKHLNDLCDQIADDVKAKKARHLNLNQNGDVFAMVYTQQRKFDPWYDIKLSNDESPNYRIVIFHGDGRMLFQAKRGSRIPHQFIDLKKCLDFIDKNSKSKIFLVISGNTVPLEIQSTFDYPQLHSVYLFRIMEFKSPLNKRKVSGLFHKLTDLSKKLHNDIDCFRKQCSLTSEIYVCSKLNQDKTLISQLNDKQIDFLRLQLFIDILLQTPALVLTAQNLISIGSKLFNQVANQGIQSYIQELYKYYKENNHSEQNLTFLQTISRCKENNQNDLIASQEPLLNIQKCVLEWPKIFGPIIVYLAEIISEDTLEMMQSSIGEYISIGTFVLASKSLLTARSIARQVTFNRLIPVLFEIEVIRGTHLLNYDNDHVIFSLGPVFELESINLASDNVWYVKIKYADAQFQLLKEQLQIETGVQLSWLTYGNYLSFLNRVQLGSIYYEYILEKSRAQDIHWSPIKNNYGLMYTSIEIDQEAQRQFSAALVGNKSSSLEPSNETFQNQLSAVASLTNMIFSITEIDLSTVFGRIGMIYYKMNNHPKALEFYKKAFESAPNQLYRYYYHQRILMLSKNITDDSIDISVQMNVSDTYISAVKATDKQTFIGVWLHDNSLSTDQQDKMRLYLNRIFYYYRIFNDIMKFSTYIGKEQLLSKVFLIVSDVTLYPALVKLVNKKQEIFEKVYILTPENYKTEMTIDCFKTSSAKTLFEELGKDIFQYTIEENPLNIVANEMEDTVQLNLIEKLEISYQAYEVIKYYTEYSYLSRTVNQAFHSGNMKQIFEFRVYISDLHQKLNELDREQETDDTKSSIDWTYFVTTLSESVLQQLIDNEGGFILFNDFLSTTLYSPVAFIFDNAKQVGTENRSVLFQFHIDKKIKQPYADISKYGSKSDESEILFSFGSVWRIQSVSFNENLYTVVLTSYDELESQLIELRKKYIEEDCTLMSLGDILSELEDDQAEWFYRKMLEQESLDEKIQGSLYYKIGMIRFAKKDYHSAVENLEKSAHLLESSYHKMTEVVLPRPLYMYKNESVLLTVYNNIGFMFQKNGKCDEAVEHYQKALKEKGTSFELATVHDNLGLLYFQLGDYTEARKHHLKALEHIDESELYWAEFKKNFDHVNEYSQYLVNKQIDDSQGPTFDNLSRAREPGEDQYGKSGGIIEFRLNDDDRTTNNVRMNTNSTSRTLPQNSDKKKNITILSFDVELPNKNVLPSDIEPFSNPFEFVARTLSFKDKTIYVIISTNKGRSVIPMIHKHFCIEKIYVYGPTVAESSFTWSSISEKIDGPYLDITNICDQIVNDIKLLTERPLCWDRSVEFFAMLHTQRLENKYSVIEVSTDTPHDEHIVIFHCNNQKRFHAYQQSIPTSEFTNVEDCTRHINKEIQSQIFLVISGSMVPLEIESILDSRQIHAIYYFSNNKPINKTKVSGLFDKLEELFKQLHKDIMFYREQYIHTGQIDMCTKLDQKNMHPNELTEEQIIFLRFQLFSDIIPQTPLLNYKQEDLTKICDSLYPNKGEKTARYVNQFKEESGNMEIFVQDPKFSQIALRLHQLHQSNQLNDWFILQKSFIDIQERISQSVKISTMDTVYLTKIISNNTLETLKSSSDKFISLGMFILATKSVRTARTIARQAVNNGLTPVLFEIEVISGGRLLNIDGTHFIFPLGAIFCSKSINQAPDGVWNVKMKCVDKEFHRITEQLQFVINVKLSWLTYGNYLYFLNRFEEGEAYFKFLIDKLSSEHIYQSAIYNNMGLLYTKKHEEIEDDQGKEYYLNKATMAYNKVLESVESNSIFRRTEDQPDKEISTTDVIPANTSIDYSSAVGNIADLYYKANKYEEAMKSYMEALESSVDQQLSRYYQKMILAIKGHLEK